MKGIMMNEKTKESQKSDDEQQLNSSSRMAGSPLRDFFHSLATVSANVINATPEESENCTSVPTNVPTNTRRTAEVSRNEPKVRDRLERTCYLCF